MQFHTSAQPLGDEPAAEASDQGLWIQGRLVAYMMSSAWQTQLTLLFIVPVVFGVLYANAWMPGLWLWLAAVLAITAHRLKVIHHYRRTLADAAAPLQLAFMRRYQYTWPLSALVWASVNWLQYDKVPLQAQFICWTISIVVLNFAMVTFSAHLPTMRAYVHASAASNFVVIAWNIGYVHSFLAPSYQYAMLVLLSIYWVFLLKVGQRLHDNLRAGIQLQQANADLIRSLKEQTRTALNAVQTKNRFIASAAHDLRQPVHALRLYADWLQNEPELASELTPKIVRSTEAVNELFDALFDLVRLDSGKFKPQWQEVDLLPLARDLMLQYAPLAESKGIALRLRGVPAVGWSDAIMLRRIVGNLLSNAVKHTRQGGVLLAIRPHGSSVRLEVWDTGLGIAPEHQQMIFREFYRIPMHQGTEDGFGLGLSIVSRLSVALGHPLTLHSRPGRGTLFRLTLPRAVPSPAAHPQGVAVQPSSNPVVRAK